MLFLRPQYLSYALSVFFCCKIAVIQSYAAPSVVCSYYTKIICQNQFRFFAKKYGLMDAEILCIMKTQKQKQSEELP